MQAVAKGNNLRISPLKLRKVIKPIKGLKVDDALSMMRMLPNKAAKMTYKDLYSARANYMQLNIDADASDLKILEIFVNQGTTLKRMLPRARGRADVLHKPYAHMTIKIDVVDSKAESK